VHAVCAAVPAAAVRGAGGGGWGLAPGWLSRWLGCLASRSASRSAGCAIAECLIAGLRGDGCCSEESVALCDRSGGCKTRREIDQVAS
jgi:hypothetical protein